MRLMRGLGIAWLLACLGGLVACQGPVENTAMDAVAAGSVPPAGLGAALPAPQTIQAGLAIPHTPAALVTLRLGSEFEAGACQHVEPDSTAGCFTPAWTSNQDSNDKLAFALYRFNLQDYPGVQSLQFDWRTPPADFANVWVGLSNWSTDRWDWRSAASGQVLFCTPGLAAYAAPASGDMLVVIVMLGTAPATLERLRVGNTALDDWRMDGRESRHNRRSPFTGPATPALKWTYSLGGDTYSSPSIGRDGTVYVGSNGGGLSAIKPDGTLQWNYDAGFNSTSCPAIADDGTIYIGSVDCNLYALNPDGTLKWTFPTGDIINCSPTIGADGTIYIGSQDTNLYAISPAGVQQWAYPSGGEFSTPALATDGTVYGPNWEHNFFAINPGGSWKWSYETTSFCASTPAIGADGTVYFTTWDDLLHAVNPDGSGSWTAAIGEFLCGSVAIGTDGTIYAGSSEFGIGDQGLFAFSAAGSRQWLFAIDDFVGTPAIDAVGTIYVGSFDANLYAVNPDGTAKWSFSLPSGMMTCPAIGADGTLYCAANTGTLQAIGNAPD